MGMLQHVGESVVRVCPNPLPEDVGVLGVDVELPCPPDAQKGRKAERVIAG